MAVVTRRTGLSPAVIRSWERRHRAIAPSRSSGNRRLYSEGEVQRLQLLAEALGAGWQIGQVAGLDDQELQDLIGAARSQAPAKAPGTEGSEQFLAHCMDDVANLEGARLAAHLEEAAVALSRVGLFDNLLGPLMRRVGDECASGGLRIAHEHFASSAVAAFVGGLQAAFEPPASAPVLVVATPAFQHHAVGALLVAATGRVEGWRTVDLGANLPAEEIAAAARQRKARAVAVSITYPRDDSRVAVELRRLGRLIAGTADLLVGGASARAYQAVLDEVGAQTLDNLGALRDYLRAHG